LNIHKIYGKKPGPTLMLIGGIQGNEPGGFFSADLYADMSLEKGNLIVVPRANFYSIPSSRTSEAPTAT
jgi:predicted deacylase